MSLSLFGDRINAFKRPMQVYTYDVEFKICGQNEKADEILPYCVSSISLPTVAIQPIDDIHFGGYKLSLPTYNTAERTLKIDFEENDEMYVTKTLNRFLKQDYVINLENPQEYTCDITIALYDEYASVREPTKYKYRATLIEMSAPDFNRNGTVGACKVTTSWFVTPRDKIITRVRSEEPATPMKSAKPKSNENSAVQEKKGLIVLTASHLPPIIGMTAQEYKDKAGGKASLTTQQIEYNLNYDIVRDLEFKFRKEGYDVLVINDTAAYKQKVDATWDYNKTHPNDLQHNVRGILKVKNDEIKKYANEHGFEQNQIVNIDVDHNAIDDKGTPAKGIGFFADTKDKANTDMQKEGNKIINHIKNDINKKGEARLHRGDGIENPKAAGTTTDVENVGATLDIEFGYYDNATGLKQRKKDRDSLTNSIVRGVNKYFGV